MITKFPTYYVFGTTTNVGKTLFSAGLCKEATLQKFRVKYIKPIQTGFPTDSDTAFVDQLCDSKLLDTKNIVTLEKPVSPHRALEQINIAHNFSEDFVINTLKEQIEYSNVDYMFIEGAGGVASPSFDNNLQCDLYRNLLLPVVFVADPALGGISTSISSIELLEARGFKVACVLLFSGEHENEYFLLKHLSESIPVFYFHDLKNYNSVEQWFEINRLNFSKSLSYLSEFHQIKIREIEKSIAYSKEHIWWPFTQHRKMSEPKYIDSAYGDFFSVYDSKNQRKGVAAESIYDGTASWWTQNLGHGWAAITKAAQRAAGRYGHVMLPGNTHEPVALLTEKLLNSVGRDWAKRAFYSDNGSTANEVALKMAFHYTVKSQKLTQNQQEISPIVLGLKDSYHGDTLAAVDATSENSFKNLNYWYKPRGFWLDYPTISIISGNYILFIPKEISIEYGFDTNITFLMSVRNFQDFYNLHIRDESIEKIYSAYIKSKIDHLEKNNVLIGACLLEGIVHGAGGMKFIDPLFQKMLIEYCQNKNIPVILDEVFTGFWRFGFMSAAELIGVKPDIACYGKSLTGGLMSLSVTLTQEHIYSSFLGDDLASAFLHGHSYSGNPVGCAVACEALSEISNSKFFDHETNKIKPMWNENLLREISFHEKIARICLLGTVLVIEIKTYEEGYLSKSAHLFIEYLKKCHIEARPLGNVVYIMTTLNTKKSTILYIQNCISTFFKEAL